MTVTNDVSAFCTERLLKLLTESGFRIGSAPDAVVITPELLSFNVVEDNLYQGDVRLRMNITVPGSAPLSALYTGTSKRFGRSQSADNYNEALSNAFAGAVAKFVKDDAVFGKSMTPERQ